MWPPRAVCHWPEAPEHPFCVCERVCTCVHVCERLCARLLDTASCQATCCEPGAIDKPWQRNTARGREGARSASTFEAAGFFSSVLLSRIWVVFGLPPGTFRSHRTDQRARAEAGRRSPSLVEVGGEALKGPRERFHVPDICGRRLRAGFMVASSHLLHTLEPLLSHQVKTLE